MNQLAVGLRALTENRGRAVTETATVDSVAGSYARVKRAGQTVATRLIPVAPGVTVAPADKVQVLKLNGNINTALITGKAL